ncbi:hypothetical protein BN946_scf184876.g19 [Trametes cinnabarina]|uniref:3'-5' exonuclease n=1 Tax=Pycnoporus cinnabarinus TaxID=5643 RepID=A0A060SPL6_PYCCI|nr:hypothetical protein BN946_scf184876.g19 [Trametes cinnabarina]
MAANALKETKIPAALCHRISPPSSPSRGIRARSASHAASAPISQRPSIKSKLLATLDAEIPKWLSGPTASLPESVNTLAEKTTQSLVDPNPLHPFFSKSQSSTDSTMPTRRTRTKTAPASSSGKGKGRANPIPALPASDIENHPDAALGVAEDTEEPLAPAVPLPPYSYKDYMPAPAVVYTPDEGEANDLVQCLKGPVLGFDLEWVVVFRRGQSRREHRTALVQLSDARMIVLVQLSAMKKFPEKVKALIENKDIIKVGANIKNDGHKLFRDYGILARGLAELGSLAHQADPAFSQTYKRSIVSLASVVEMYTQKTLAKGKVRTSNWEKAPLSQEQQFYRIIDAANDAHCALMVYNRLAAIAAENGMAISPEVCAADLAQEYQAKTPSGHVTVPAFGSTSSLAPLQPASTSLLAAAALPPSSSVSGASRTRSRFYARPLAIAGERTSSNTGSATTYRPPRPQHLRAYNLWHHRNMPLTEICAALRSADNPLARSTVISYVVWALQADPTLPFSMARLKEFVQLESGSWARHREWILQKAGYTG